MRRAAVAGTWYPSDAARLRAEVERHVADASRHAPELPGDAHLVALVAPHAGLMYSGPVAASAYRLLAAHAFETIVLVGPSHYVSFEGASLWPRGAFETPLGPLEVDEAIAAEVARACPIVQDLPAAHTREHSLEMQLPFLARYAPDVPIVPIVMGWQTRDCAFALADGLVAALGGRRTLLIASSDLSHFFDAATAASLDEQVLETVEPVDAEGLMDLLEGRPDHACGGGPMVAVMRAARALGAGSGRVLCYADSGDVSGDKSSVVGYMAAALWG